MAAWHGLTFKLKLEATDMENQSFDLVLRYTLCRGWCCLYVFNGVEVARGGFHREFDDAVLEAADLAEVCGAEFVATVSGVAK
jgi:hypothetical protein